MSIDSILVYFSLIIAVYSIIPKYKQLDLKIRWNIFDTVIAVCSLLAIHYLLYIKFFKNIGLYPKYSINNYSLTPNSVAYIVLLIGSLLIFIHLKYSKLSKRKIFKFREYIYELISEEKFDILSKSIEYRLNDIVTIYNRNFIVYKIKKKFTTSGYQQLKVLIEQAEVYNFCTEKNCFRKFLGEKISLSMDFLVRPLPNYEAHQNAARDTIRTLLTNKKFIQYIATSRPYFAITLIECNFFETHEFIDLFVKNLIQDKSSVFYRELNNNQSTLIDHRYFLPVENKLIFYLLSDAKKAEKLSIWRPIGEAVIQRLKDLNRQDSDRDPYNLPMDNFLEKGKFESSIYCSIFFFDIMVTEALYQGIKWHMWLYYFPYFVRGIIGNYKPNTDIVDLRSEFPTRYNYLIYEIFYTMESWINCIENIPPEQENVVLQSTNLDHENGNIIKSSIISYGQCLKYLIESEKITDTFKNYIIHMSFQIYLKLSLQERTENYSEVFIRSIKNGGSSFSSDSKKLIEFLQHSFDEFDKIPYPQENINQLKNYLGIH